MAIHVKSGGSGSSAERGTSGMARNIFGILIAVFVLFSLAPSFYELSRMGDLHPERQFELVHNFPTDYNFYLSRIREGLEGRWTAVERYTSEPHTGTFIHGMYVLMGQAGRFVRVPLHRAGDIYHVARAIGAVVLLLATAEFCRRLLGAARRMPAGAGVIAFMVVLTASSWPKLVAVVENQVVPATADTFASWRFGGYMAWWSVMDSLQRITFIPHIVAGQALIVVLLMVLTKPERFKKSVNVVLTGIALFALGMIFPPGLVFLYATLGIWWLFARRGIWKWTVPYAVMAAMGGASLAYLALMTGFYPWKRLAEVDIIRPLPFDYVEYVKAVGPVLPLGIVGLLLALFSWETALFPAVSWVVGWALLLILFAFVPQQSPLRFSEMAPHIPLGVLSAYCCFRLLQTKHMLMRYLGAGIITLLIAGGLFHMYSSYLWQRDFVDHKIRATLPLVPTGSFVMYPLKDFINAMWYLFDATKGTGVILSETTAGNYIPVISGNVVYAGHDNTVAFEGKKERVKAFFSGAMKPREAESWVRESRITYVYYGPQEQEDGRIPDLTAYYPFLEKTYANARVTIYRVR